MGGRELGGNIGPYEDDLQVNPSRQLYHLVPTGETTHDEKVLQPLFRLPS